MELTTLQSRLEEKLSHNMSDDDGSHDAHHVRRVWINAQEIIRHLDAEPEAHVVLAATYLHDLVNVPKNAPNRSQASRLSAQAAIPILHAIDFPQDKIDAVAHAITAHSFSAKVTPKTLEAKIVQDADRLESLGALGIARTFYTAGRMNSALFHADDPFGRHRSLDDQAFAVDHFKTKLLRLPDTMQTQAGAQVARIRADAMRVFLAQLGSEIGTQFPADRY